MAKCGMIRNPGEAPCGAEIPDGDEICDACCELLQQCIASEYLRRIADIKPQEPDDVDFEV